jgi:hypothetical protein
MENTPSRSQLANEFCVATHDLEMSLIKLQKSLTSKPETLTMVSQLLTAVAELRKSVAKKIYDPSQHCQNCYEQADFITEKLDTCENCFECLVAENDPEHLYRCWKVWQAE